MRVFAIQSISLGNAFTVPLDFLRRLFADDDVRRLMPSVYQLFEVRRIMGPDFLSTATWNLYEVFRHQSFADETFQKLMPSGNQPFAVGSLNGSESNSQSSIGRFRFPSKFVSDAFCRW